jgi:glycosyltransferase involved in cell wall biosynthesis
MDRTLKDTEPCILMITPFFSGLRPWLLEDKEPTGMPGVVNLVRALLGDGIRVTWLILTKTPEDAEHSPQTKMGGQLEIRIEVIPQIARILDRLRPRLASDPLSFLPLFALGLIKGVGITRNRGIDLIYTGGGEGIQAIGSTLAGLRRVPCVSRIFGTPLAKYLKTSHPAAGMALRRPSDSLSMACPCDLMVVTDDGTRGNQVARCLGSPRGGRLLFIRNGVDPSSGRDGDIDLRDMLQLPQTTRILSWVSRFDHWKRVDIAIRAMARIVAEEPDAVLLIAGYGRRAVELMDLASSLGLENSVIFLGPLPASGVRSLLSSADIYISTYDYHANVSNTFLEALSEGCCVVTLRDEATERIIDHSRNGYLIAEDRAVDELSDTVTWLLANPAAMRRAAKRAPSVTRIMGTWEKRMRREISAIRELC